MKFQTLIAASLLAATAASATTFESGNWAAAHVGHACYVFTQFPAKHTSGALVLTFYNQGYNASLSYNYAQWPGETEAPWDANDYPALELDGEPSWLGDEMFTHDGPAGYSIEMTDGMLSEFIGAIDSTKSTIDVMIERETQKETVVFGRFSPEGFGQALQRAGEWCQFDPSNLPAS
ncbi:hypothetical protein J7382_09410 [Shimia sp. R11_0]|uniref:hypothetical protein n=1 Tax=Shimia sp. R11_0 TaxID=2821096 RepID=UPI001ADB897A|nr:hypothetical protein [Shimia sp. R11_0]MBO9477750.1 hypothetical protein [Shimia sp. R11_0]